MPRRPLGGLKVEREVEEDHTDETDLERQWLARRHFPHLSPSVAPRESDETPTFWED